ncbi:hypothetical protein MMC10_004388 [Thelotrema lepadinum]|nr:hypothetical protein [Thelotrema lepadinum]
MPVPPAAALHAGVSVNIVLKADQRSGKLTPGRVADVLTRGDHPHGVKVRLQDGRIGRVQSLSKSSELSTGSGHTSADEISLAGHSTSTVTPQDFGDGFYMSLQGGPGRHQRGGARYADGGDEYTSVPPEARSLQDFVTFKPPKRVRDRGVSNRNQSESEAIASTNSTRPGLGDDNQQILQGEFPQIDSALIAAILSDGQTMEGARTVLSALS